MDGEEINNLDDLYQQFYRYIHWLAHCLNKDHKLHILLSDDDLAGDLFEELVKGWRHYGDKLPTDQLLRVIRKMLDNRIGELIYKYHVTYRRHDAKAISYDVLMEALDGQIWENPRELAEHWRDKRVAIAMFRQSAEQSRFTTSNSYMENLDDSARRTDQFLNSLTLEEYRIVEAILTNDKRVGQQIKLRGIRKKFVYQNGGTIRINADLIADALHVDRPAVRRLWRSIKKKWREHEQI